MFVLISLFNEDVHTVQEYNLSGVQVNALMCWSLVSGEHSTSLNGYIQVMKYICDIMFCRVIAYIFTVTVILHDDIVE